MSFPMRPILPGNRYGLDQGPTSPRVQCGPWISLTVIKAEDIQELELVQAYCARPSKNGEGVFVA